MIPRRAVGWILAVLTTVLVVANQEQVGIARDEMVYMSAGDRYADWWLAYVVGGVEGKPSVASRDAIARTFGGPNPTDNNREHPPLVKTLFGISHRILHDGLGVDELTAYRIPSALLHGLLVLLVFTMVLELWGFGEALVSALLVVFLPRALFHAGLACFDAPIMTLWFATIYTYWRCLDGRKWPWQVGVVFGLALATKHTALLLPFALGAHYLIAGHRAGGLRGMLAFRWRVIVSLAVLGPLTLIAVWPWLWFDPYAHVKDWLVFHMTHVHYNFEYLGTNWNAPRFPWHVALVTTLFTVPVATLGAAVLGAGVWIANRRHGLDRVRAPALLLGLSAVASIGPFFLGSTPIFGAEKHWMPALPSICIAAGVGTMWAARTLANLLPARRLVLGLVVTLVVGAGAVETVTAQPYALTWYNALAGGAPGGADRGMNRQFWGVAAEGTFPVLAAQVPPLFATVAREVLREPRKRLGLPAVPERQVPVYSHDASPAWGFYQKLGELPRSLPDAGSEQAGIARSQLAIVIHERHFNRHDYLIWSSYGTVQPIFVLRAHGVPIVSVYQRPAPAKPTKP
jgi:4-amino-4-deoxy-L-arabinose transferase-like glycosyltransferase